MKIQAINNNYSKYSKPVANPSFKSFYREVKADSSKVLWRNNTTFFRNDLAWTDLAKFLKDKYAKTDKVNVFMYACSNGLEAYSFLMKMFSCFNENFVKKFTPIIAKDFDSFPISVAKKKMVDIEPVEVERINFHTNDNFDEYFSKITKLENKYQPSEKLTKLVEFEVGDFTEEYKDLPKDNTILFVRNCWPYFPTKMQEELPKKLYEHLGKNSTVIVGNFDYYLLGLFEYKSYGFKPTSVPNVYEK